MSCPRAYEHPRVLAALIAGGVAPAGAELPRVRRRLTAASTRRTVLSRGSSARQEQSSWTNWATV